MNDEQRLREGMIKYTDLKLREAYSIILSNGFNKAETKKIIYEAFEKGEYLKNGR